MAPIPSRRLPHARVLPALLVALAVGAGAAGPVRAAAPSVAAVPDEPGVTTLPEPVFGALGADLDGNGTRELVTISPWQVNQAQLAVAIWRQAEDGTWFTTGQAPLRRGTSPDERRSGVPHPDAAGTLAVAAADATRLVTWHVAGRERTLALVNSDSEFNGAPPCCLTIWEVTSAPADWAPRLSLLADTGRGAADVLVADLDGDGTDELVVREPPEADTSSSVPVSVLRWDGARFRPSRTAVAVDTPLSIRMWILGDSDGAPGVEVGLLAQGACRGEPFALTRVSLWAGELLTSALCVATSGTAVAVPDGLGPGQPAPLYGDTETPISTISWPADGGGRIVAESSFARRGRPLGLLEQGGNQWVLVQRSASGRPVLELDRPDLGLTSAQGIAASPAAARLLDTPFPPYVGPWPAAPGAPDAFLFAGTLLDARPDGAPVSRMVSALPGSAPVGLVGTDGATLALLRAFAPGPGPVAAVPVASTRDPAGGPLLAGEPLLLSLAPVATVLEPESADGALAPPMSGTMPAPGSGGAGDVLAGSRSFTVDITAPEASVVLWDSGDTRRTALLASGVRGIGFVSTPVGPPYRIPVAGPPDGGARFDGSLLVLTPAGRGYRSLLSVRVMSQAPPLEVDSGLLSFGLNAMISGTTDPDARVTVDGAEVQVARDGTFGASVAAGLAPRDVRVVAADPFGHVVARSLSVVAPLDYRRLPWIPIVVVLTLIAGAVLFWRAPRPGAHAAPARTRTIEEGIVEEIDPD